MAAYVDSVALVDKIAEGAITSSGALPLNKKDWLEWADKGKTRKMRRPFRNFWDPQDRTYRIAQDEGERRAMINATKNPTETGNTQINLTTNFWNGLKNMEGKFIMQNRTEGLMDLVALLLQKI